MDDEKMLLLYDRDPVTQAVSNPREVGSSTWHGIEGRFIGFVSFVPHDQNKIMAVIRNKVNGSEEIFLVEYDIDWVNGNLSNKYLLKNHGRDTIHGMEHVELNGENGVVFAFLEFAPQLSPDGRHMLLYRKIGDRYFLLHMDRNGATRTLENGKVIYSGGDVRADLKLDSNEWVPDVTPIFSPTGDKLFFTFRKEQERKVFVVDWSPTEKKCVGAFRLLIDHNQEIGQGASARWNLVHAPSVTNEGNLLVLNKEGNGDIQLRMLMPDGSIPAVIQAPPVALPSAVTPLSNQKPTTLASLLAAQAISLPGLPNPMTLGDLWKAAIQKIEADNSKSISQTAVIDYAAPQTSLTYKKLPESLKIEKASSIIDVSPDGKGVLGYLSRPVPKNSNRSGVSISFWKDGYSNALDDEKIRIDAEDYTITTDLRAGILGMQEKLIILLEDRFERHHWALVDHSGVANQNHLLTHPEEEFLHWNYRLEAISPDGNIVIFRHIKEGTYLAFGLNQTTHELTSKTVLFEKDKPLPGGAGVWGNVRQVKFTPDGSRLWIHRDDQPLFESVHFDPTTRALTDLRPELHFKKGQPIPGYPKGREWSQHVPKILGLTTEGVFLAITGKGGGRATSLLLAPSSPNVSTNSGDKSNLLATFLTDVLKKHAVAISLVMALGSFWWATFNSHSFAWPVLGGAPFAMIMPSPLLGVYLASVMLGLVSLPLKKSNQQVRAMADALLSISQHDSADAQVFLENFFGPLARFDVGYFEKRHADQKLTEAEVAQLVHVLEQRVTGSVSENKLSLAQAQRLVQYLSQTVGQTVELKAVDQSIAVVRQSDIPRLESVLAKLSADARVDLVIDKKNEAAFVALAKKHADKKINLHVVTNLLLNKTTLNPRAVEPTLKTLLQRKSAAHILLMYSRQLAFESDFSADLFSSETAAVRVSMLEDLLSFETMRALPFELFFRMARLLSNQA